MPRLSTLSNPTGLVDIDRNRVSILIDDSGKIPAFSLVRLDLKDVNLVPPLDVVIIASRGNSEERIELGSAFEPSKAFNPLPDIGDDGVWKFRLLLVSPGSSLLVAAAENIRPDGQGESESFVALEAAELGEVPWRIDIEESLGIAVLLFNRDIYRSVGEAVADQTFMAFILPEAIRRLASWIAARAAALEDPAWEPLKAWLVLHGIAELPDTADAHQQLAWCDEVVDVFCNRFEFATKLAELRMKGAEE